MNNHSKSLMITVLIFVTQAYIECAPTELYDNSNITHPVTSSPKAFRYDLEQLRQRLPEQRVKELLKKISPDNLKMLRIHEVQSFQPEHLQFLDDRQFRGLLNNIEYFTPEQIKKIPPHIFKELTPRQIKELTPRQITALTPEQIYLITAEQITALTPEQIAIFMPDQLKVFDAEKILALSDAQIATCTTQELSNFVDTLYTTMRNIFDDDQSGLFYVMPLARAKSKWAQIQLSDLYATADFINYPASIAKEDTIRRINITQLTPDEVQKFNRQQLDRLSLQQITNLSDTQLNALDTAQKNLLKSRLLSINSEESHILKTLNRENYYRVLKHLVGAEEKTPDKHKVNDLRQ